MTRNGVKKTIQIMTKGPGQYLLTDKEKAIICKKYSVL